LASNSLLNKSKNTLICTANHWPWSTINKRMECMSSDMIFNWNKILKCAYFLYFI